MEWQAPGIVLDARPYAEGDAVVTLLTAEHGAHRGLARGALSRARAAVWQPGNLIQARWVARLTDQLGTLTGELVHAGAAVAMQDPLTLAVLSSACSVAAGALPEREAHPRVFDVLLNLIAHLSSAEDLPAAYVRFELLLLADLGFGLDLSTCAVTGASADLAFVSPRTGRAVARAAAGLWRDRLLALPAFLLGDAAAEARDWADGLRLTGHFLARDAFGHQHRPLPQARVMLSDRIELLAASELPHGG
jgi:DNA repair protein RecO (recombination protein O)